MVFPYLLFSHFVTITAAYLAILSGIKYFKFRTPLTRWAGWFMFFLAAELITFSYQLVAGPFESIHISYYLQSAFFLILSFCWLLFIMAIVDLPAKMKHWLMIALLGAAIIAAFFLPIDLSFARFSFVPGETSTVSFLRLGEILGLPGRFVLFLLYNEGIVCLYLLYRLSKNANKFNRIFAVPMLIGTIVLYALIIMEHAGVHPFAPFHLTQIGLVGASFAVFFFAVVWRFGGFLPISRESVFDRLRDGVLILNWQDEVIDLNSSALDLFGKDRREILDKPLHLIWPDGAERLILEPNTQTLDDECIFLIDGQEYTFSINITRLIGLNQSMLGSVLVMRNITSLDRMELVLHERNKELQRSNNYLEALAEVNTRLHEAVDVFTMNTILGEELKKLGLVCFIARLDPSSGDLVITYFSGRVDGMLGAEKLVGESVVGFHLDKKQFARLYKFVHENQIYFDVFDRSSLHRVQGKIPLALLEQAVRMVGLAPEMSALILPLYTRDWKLGLMGVWGEDLREADIPPFRIFANQVSYVMERAIQYDDEIKHSAELKRVNDLTTALSRVASVIGSTPDYGLLFDTLGRELRENGLNCAVANINTETQTAYLNYISVTPGILNLFERKLGLNLRNFAIPNHLWPGNKLLTEQKPSWYSNPRKIFSRVFPNVPEKMLDRAFILMRIKSTDQVCFLPLIYQNDTIGVLVLWGLALREEDYPILSVFSSQISGILQKLDRYQEQVQRSDKLARANAIILALSKVAVKLDTLSNLDNVYAVLGEELQTVGINCMVGILDETKENMLVEHVMLRPGIIRFSERLGAVWPEKPSIPRRSWPTKQVVDKGIPFWDDDAVDSTKKMFPAIPRVVFEKAFKISGLGNDGQICYIPMVNRDEVFGILALWGDGLQKEDVPALTVFANQLASAINNIRLYEQAQGEIEERRQAEALILEALEDKEVLLKEVHHRVKNNLQIISSLLNLQLAQTKDEITGDILRESQNRVRSMALIHEKLYQSSDLAQVDFDGYLHSLVTSLRQTYRIDLEKVMIDVRSDNVSFSIDTAIPCGLIVNELVSNSLKYAFDAGDSGRIAVTCEAQGNERYILAVEDNGAGLPEDFDIEQVNTLGLKLVNSLVRQIDGELNIKKHKGTRFEIEFSEVVD